MWSNFVGSLLVGSCIIRTLNKQVKKMIRTSPPNYEQLRSKLVWLPVETVKRTFEATTQYAVTLPVRYPLRRHLKSRFPQLHPRRLAETFATDTFFSSVTALGGVTCVQLFVGNSSMYTAAYGMKSESEGTAALQDFIRDVGAPHTIRNDNARMQTGSAWKQILRRFAIKSEHTEPHHPQQNPAERRWGGNVDYQCNDIHSKSVRENRKAYGVEITWLHVTGTFRISP